MVCLGNICRSPLAQGILEAKIKNNSLDWIVDSAGTSGYHSGEAPDIRSIEIAKKNGIEINSQQSRRIEYQDLKSFDLILVMDQSNLQNLRSMTSENLYQNKIKLILDFVYPGQNRAVPDPYYDNGFEKVYDMLDQAADHIINHFRTNSE